MALWEYFTERPIAARCTACIAVTRGCDEKITMIISIKYELYKEAAVMIKFLDIFCIPRRNNYMQSGMPFILRTEPYIIQNGP